MKMPPKLVYWGYYSRPFRNLEVIFPSYIFEILEKMLHFQFQPLSCGTAGFLDRNIEGCYNKTL